MFIKKIGSLTAWKQGLQAQRRPRPPPSRPPPPRGALITQTYTPVLFPHITSCKAAAGGSGVCRAPLPCAAVAAAPPPGETGSAAMQVSPPGQGPAGGKSGRPGSTPAHNVRRKQGQRPCSLGGGGWKTTVGRPRGPAATTKTGGDSLSGEKSRGKRVWSRWRLC